MFKLFYLSHIKIASNQCYSRVTEVELNATFSESCPPLKRPWFLLMCVEKLSTMQIIKALAPHGRIHKSVRLARW